MSDMVKVVFSLSLSGTLLILALFLCKFLFGKKVSRRWQYYIWLAAAVRLLLPFAPETNLMGTLFEHAEQSIGQGTIFLTSEDGVFETEESGASVHEEGTVREESNISASETDAAAAGEDAKSAEGESGILKSKNDMTPVSGVYKGFQLIRQNLWVIWAAVAAFLLIRKITMYQSFVKYVRTGREEVSEIKLLDWLAKAGERMGVKRPVELYTNSLVSSPMLLGFFRPCIILPKADIRESDFMYTAYHELVHYKHCDILYKWLMQITACLHWFNPLVWLMKRETECACELACDEAVIRSLDEEGRRSYGDTLLHMIESGGSLKDSLASLTLSKEGELLKERLGAIAHFKKRSKAAVPLCFVLTAALLSGAVLTGAAAPAGISGRQGNAASSGREETGKAFGQDMSDMPAGSWDTDNGEAASRIEKYYENESLPGFGRAFGMLDEKAKGEWLERVYEDDEIAFFSVALDLLSAESPWIDTFARKAYEEGNISFFSVLTGHMDEAGLEAWLDKALQDRKVNFQSVLFTALDRDWEKEELEEELERQRLKEYEEYGITRVGKQYYYQGRLVSVFLDMKKDSSFYTLDMNPEGVVNVKIDRDADGRIKSVEYLTDEEGRELFGDDWQWWRGGV